MKLTYSNSRWSLYRADGTLHAYTEDSDMAFNLQIALAKMDCMKGLRRG